MNTEETSRADAPLVLILGLGETGAAAARWCAREGARLRVADTRTQPGGLDALRVALREADVQYHLGCASQFDEALLDGVSQLVLSPGCRRDRSLRQACSGPPPHVASRS